MTSSTENFIRNFLIKETAQFQQHLTSSEKVNNWIHKHPTVMKTIEVMGVILSLASIANLFLSWPKLGTRTILLTFAGGVLGIISLIAYKVLDILIPPNHEMRHHVFKPASYGETGRLYYQGNIPILELNCDDPHKTGVAHGYLMGEYLDRLLNRLNFIKTHLINSPLAQDIPHVLASIRSTIPKEYIEEMEGVVDGFNQWAMKKKWIQGKKMTLDDLLLFHLMPDSIHFSPLELENQLQTQNNQPPQAKGTKQEQQPPILSLACTVVIDRDANEGIIFGRNMDWISFGIFGSHSLIINRKHPTKKLSTVEVGLPGFVGTLTGMNSKGLSLAMNVCGGNTHKIEGMPAAFFNRMCLENCPDVESVIDKAQQVPPLGPYHLNVADHTKAKSVHFFQKANKQHVIRNWEEGTPLITTNCQYMENGVQNSHMHCSQQRDLMINKLFNEASANIPAESLERSKLVKSSLSLPYVDNELTTHRVFMSPKSKEMQVAFNNAYAGNSNLEKLDTSTLLN